MALNVQLSIANAARTMGRGAAERPAMTSDTHEIEKAGFRFDRLGFPEFTLCPLDRVKVSPIMAPLGIADLDKVARAIDGVLEKLATAAIAAESPK